MRDCTNADLRDLLPDYAFGTLPAGERVRVETHLATCADCRAELALLRAVRAARPESRVVDVSRIVAALPRPNGSVAAERAGVTPSRTSPRGGTWSWRRISGIAAVFAGVVAAGALWRHGQGEDVRTGAERLDPVSVASRLEGTTPPAPTGTAPLDDSAPGSRLTTRSRVGSEHATTDAVGALGGVASGASDEELEALISALESLSSVPDVDVVEGEGMSGGTE